MNFSLEENAPQGYRVGVLYFRGESAADVRWHERGRYRLSRLLALAGRMCAYARMHAARLSPCRQQRDYAFKARGSSRLAEEVDKEWGHLR